jgi:hypothetical protein
MDPSPSRRRLLSTSICPLNDQGETPWDPPFLVADVFTPDFICSLNDPLGPPSPSARRFTAGFICSLNDQGETPWDPPLLPCPTLYCRLHMFFK